MAEDTPVSVPPAAPAEEASAATPLEQAPLSEYVARRGKGETQTQPAQPAESAKPAESAEPEDKDDISQDAQKSPPARKDFKSRFDQIYRQRSEAMRNLDSANQRISALEAELQHLRRPVEPPQPAQPQLPQQADKPPVLDEWLAAGKTYEDWLDARNDWRIARAIQQERQRAAQQAHDQQINEQVSGFGERTEAALKKYPDYEEQVINNDRVQLSPVMMDIARRSPHG